MRFVINFNGGLIPGLGSRGCLHVSSGPHSNFIVYRVKCCIFVVVVFVLGFATNMVVNCNLFEAS